MTKTIFVYLNRAYTSEADLLKFEGVLADEASLFKYDGEAPAVLWRAQGGPEGDLIVTDPEAAYAEFQAGAECVFRVSVIGEDAEPAGTKFVLARDRECVPDFV